LTEPLRKIESLHTENLCALLVNMQRVCHHPTAAIFGVLPFVCAGMSPKILELVSVTPESTLVEHGVYVRPAASTIAASFGQGRVFVMGDAAHPMRPWGQGYTQAVEDAYALGWALGKGGSPGAIDLESLQVSMEPVRHSCNLLN
jgi:hypothetical protein